jgi:signal peptidase I
VERFTTILGGQLHRGDVVAYRWPPDPQEKFVHRIVALPGDRLRLRNKRLFLNGVEADEPYAQHSTSYFDAYRDNFPQPLGDDISLPRRERIQQMLQHVANGELVIPAGCYFVMGDNRDDAADSRYFGFIRRDDVIGVAILSYGANGFRGVGKRGQ